ncbi:hypothetical protein GOP47_0006294 [Adiantum capillus-veneris]|uniref:Uncharacterized protein n=1 Tax=Adiantum capillus-veneris TaxID=13818 RepID=A0A9D4ZK61_ADICA|nr:hypothetical protein GOP47_0006294 [Adiantum capillus-veneris]
MRRGRAVANLCCDMASPSTGAMRANGGSNEFSCCKREGAGILAGMQKIGLWSKMKSAKISPNKNEEEPDTSSVCSLCRSRLGRLRRMNARRVLIPPLVRQLRFLSSSLSHSSRARYQHQPLRQQKIFSGILDEPMDMSRRLHTVRLSHFKLSDGAPSSSSDGGIGSLLQEKNMRLSNKGDFQMALHTLAVNSKENKQTIDCTSGLRELFETTISYFQNMPAALKDLRKENPNGIFANHNLRLDRVNVFGFDYDYTLAHYSSDLQTLIYDLAVHHLVKEHRYPDTCLQFTYDKSFPIRGLYYDKKKGYLLKLDFFHSMELDCCYFGRRKVEEPEIEAVYGGKRIGAEHMPNLVALMDLFCLSEVCLISDVIHHFVETNTDFDASYVYEDVKRSIEFVHKSGFLHQKILEEPAKYLVKSQGVVQMLRNLKNSGKSLFLLTNSPFPFVDGGMKYMFEEDTTSGGSWRELFDFVIALADKPNFYTSERPFRHYNLDRDVLSFSKVDSFQRHSVYYHGCLKHFLEITKWKGPEVLYFGDHLYSDLRGPAKAGWRTAAIIRELEREIRTQNEDAYRFHQAKYHSMQHLLGLYHGIRRTRPETDAQKGLLFSLREERTQARKKMKLMFNQYFGSTFLTDTGKESAFAYNVQRYADVYTSRLENFLDYSVEAWMYTPFDVKILPHHVKVNPPSPQVMNTMAPSSDTVKQEECKSMQSL